MAKDVLNVQPRDLSSYTGSISPAGDVVFQYVNTTDQSVTVVLNGTYDTDDFTNGVEVNNQSVAAGATASFALSDPWDKLQIDASASTAPTSGSVIVKAME